MPIPEICTTATAASELISDNTQLFYGWAMIDKRDSKLIIDYGEKTHQGGRAENQDYLSASIDAERERFCFVIADGVGGYRGGRTASQLAVESILHSFGDMDAEPVGAWLYSALQKAHRLIKEKSRSDVSVRSMKTTCVATVIMRGRIYWASVGDSRIYIIRDNVILHRSKDHSVVQILLDVGEIKPEDVRSHPDRNRVLRVLGMDEEELKPTVNSEGLSLQRGDCVLLCTDGVWEYMDDSAIGAFICSHFNTRAQELLDLLFKEIETIAMGQANSKRRDNLSAQLIMVR